MKVGNGSVSLKVENLEASIAFYELLGFKQSGGNIDYRYIVLQNETMTIGLYEGLIEANMLTFNPKWNRECEQVPGDDVRDIHDRLATAGYEPEQLGEDVSVGPNHFMIKDPDGNLILIDQHL